MDTWELQASSIAYDSLSSIAKWDCFTFPYYFSHSCRNDPTQLQDDGEVPGPSSAEQEVKFWKEEESKPSNCLQKLPSFISLRSPESPSSLGCKEERDEDEPEDEPGRNDILLLELLWFSKKKKSYSLLFSMCFDGIHVLCESPNQLRLGVQTGMEVRIPIWAQIFVSVPKIVCQDFVLFF